MSLTLWYVPDSRNSRSMKILALAKLAGLKLEAKECEYGRENATDFFKRNCSPVGGYPVLQTEEGFIFESNAIARYIARIEKSGCNLYGRTPFESAQVDMWLDFATSEMFPTAMPYIMNLFLNVPIPEGSEKNVEQLVAALDSRLENRTFLVGERLTAADVVVAFDLNSFYRVTGAFGELLATKYKNTFRLFNTVMQQPKVAELLAEKEASVGPVKAPKEPKKEAAAKEPKKKAEKKKPAEDDAEEEDEAAKEEKKPNPLDALPPSPFVLDSFKKEYSNTDTRTVGAPYLFDHFDPNGFTCFWCRYKYNEENKKQFMTANLVRGWFQRMEHVRKYAFGIALIIGEEDKHDVVGFWIFRGKGMPAIVEDVVDTELFDWELIPDINAQREKITDYLCWEGPTIPKPVLEGRCFK